MISCPNRASRLRASVFCLLTVIAGAGALTAGLTWETRLIEQDAKSGSKESVAVFRFKNTGSSAIAITMVDTGCNCTVADTPERSYLPGQAGEVRAVFTHGTRVGPQENIISVTTDEDPQKPVQLTMRVNIEEPFTCSTQLLLWPAGQPPRVRSVTINSASANPIAFLDAAAEKSSELKVSVETVSPGNYRLQVQPLGNPTALNTQVNVAVQLADGAKKNFRIFAIIR